MMIYIPEEKIITVNTSFIPAKKLKIFCFDPQTGKTIKSEIVSNKKQMNFTPSTTGKGNDWVIVLDNAREKFPDLEALCPLIKKNKPVRYSVLLTMLQS